MRLIDSIINAVLKDCAGDREVLPTPERFGADGPCPGCGETIMPSQICFRDHAKVSLPGQDKRINAAALCLCSHCYTPLVCYSRGKFERIPKKVMKKLPQNSRDFFESQRKMFEALKRPVC